MEDYLDRSIDRQVNIDVYPEKKYKNKLWQIHNIYRKIDIYIGIINIQKGRYRRVSQIYRKIDINIERQIQIDRQLNRKIDS